MRPVTFYGIFSRRNAIPIVCSELAYGLLAFREVHARPFDDQYHCAVHPELEYHFVERADPSTLAVIHSFPAQASVYTKKHVNCVGGFVADGTPVGQLQVYAAMQQTSAVYVPSTWSLEAYRASGYNKPMAVVPHGVAPEYVPRPKHIRGRTLNLGMNCYSAGVWHRKALPETLQAVDRMGGKVHLTLKVGAGSEHVVKRLMTVHDVDPDLVTLDTRDDVTYSDLCDWLHRFDAILQPSRCEGAGMVGKEVLCAGVPFVGTFDTGHSDYLPAPGAVKVNTRKFVRAQSFGVGFEAMYPDVHPDDVLLALQQLDDTYEAVEAAARENAEEFYKANTWMVMAEKLHNFLLKVAP